MKRVALVHDSRYDSTITVSDEWVGSPISSTDDPRIEFQRREFERFAFLSEPVLALLDGATGSTALATIPETPSNAYVVELKCSDWPQYAVSSQHASRTRKVAEVRHVYYAFTDLNFKPKDPSEYDLSWTAAEPYFVKMLYTLHSGFLGQATLRHQFPADFWLPSQGALFSAQVERATPTNNRVVNRIANLV